MAHDRLVTGARELRAVLDGLEAIALVWDPSQGGAPILGISAQIADAMTRFGLVFSEVHLELAGDGSPEQIEAARRQFERLLR